MVDASHYQMRQAEVYVQHERTTADMMGNDDDEIIQTLIKSRVNGYLSGKRTPSQSTPALATRRDCDQIQADLIILSKKKHEFAKSPSKD